MLTRGTSGAFTAKLQYTAAPWIWRPLLPGRERTGRTYGEHAVGLACVDGIGITYDERLILESTLQSRRTRKEHVLISADEINVRMEGYWLWSVWLVCQDSAGVERWTYCLLAPTVPGVDICRKSKDPAREPRAFPKAF
jgi:hypothetical protein